MQKPRPSKMDPALVTGRLNVPDYVAARRDNIRALERLVASAGSKSKKRAFQSLPRTERRRAASHDAKRVPRRHGLRKRAELENLHANVKKPKTSKRPRPPPQAPSVADGAAFNVKATLPPDGAGVRFADRQRDKIWLPTHIWHKKRAFVEQLGNFMVPVTATQKQYRRTHRLLANKDEPGVMAWDTSFYASIVVEARASSQAFDEYLESMLPGVTAPLYKHGAKHWQGLYKNKGPVLVHWLHGSKVALICHPFLFDEVWESFASASSLSLELQDARYAIGSIDLLGANALAVLADTLVPTPTACNNALLAQWESLASLSSSDLLPSRTVFEYRACDSRLFGKRYKRHSASAGEPLTFGANVSQEAHGGVYTPDVREASLRRLFKQSYVDARKKEEVVFAPDSDAEIPVSVFVLDDGRLRVLMPRAWVLPTWLTIFTRKHAMIGGQKELHQLATERQLPFYPSDFPHVLELSTREPNLPRTHSHRKKEIFNAAEVAQHSSKLAEMQLRIARIELISRGSPESGLVVRAIPDPLVNRWLSGDSQLEPSSEAVPKFQFLGVMTSGSFNLVKAKGTGIGVIEAPAEGYSAKYCLVGNKKQDLWRVASFEFLSGGEAAAVL